MGLGLAMDYTTSIGIVSYPSFSLMVSGTLNPRLLDLKP